MKSKKVNYLLGVLVVLIWGAIIYRVVAAATDDQDPVISTKTPAKEPYDDHALKKDTTKIHSGYRDPFDLVKAPDTTTVKVKAVTIKTMSIPVAAPVINWAIFSYRGYVRNAGSKKLLAILLINGKEHMLSEGESAEQVKLLKNMRDSVKIYYHGKMKFIPLNTSAL